MDVVPELFPYSAHRTCVRHLYSNAKTSGVFIGKALKDQLWKTARATYVTQFQSAMDELKVSCGPSSQHSVNIQEWTCLCRKWQLTFILSIEDRPEKYVDSYYSVSTQRSIYSHLISPVRGEQQLATNDTMEPILSPMFRRPPGRPHKKRKREADEAPPMTGKVSKRGIRIFCKKCRGSQHNIRTCKGKVGANPKRPGQTSSSATTRAHRIPKLPLRRPRPRTTPTSQATTTQTPSSASTEPTQPSVFRWMPTPTVCTSQESSVSHSSPSPTPIPTQPSHPNVFR
ncbi:hypothetical protein V6N13_108864 [Hibiscus sabdariffa]